MDSAPTQAASKRCEILKVVLQKCEYELLPGNKRDGLIYGIDHNRWNAMATSAFKRFKKDKGPILSRTEEKSGGFLSKVFGFLRLLSSCLIVFAVVTTISIYALSYYDKKAYGNVIANILPMWTSVTSVLDPKIASKINYNLLQVGSFFDLAVQICIESFTKSYKWIKANPIMQL